MEEYNMALLNFNAANVEPSEAFAPIPADWYVAQITKSEMKPTKDGTGAFLELELTVIAGDHAKRKVFDRIHLENKNPVAVDIAMKTLSAICHAVNVIQVADSQQLHGLPLQVKVSVKPARTENGTTYEPSNEVKGYKAVGDGPTVATGGKPAGGADPAWAAKPAAAIVKSQDHIDPSTQAEFVASKAAAGASAVKPAYTPAKQPVAEAEAVPQTKAAPPWAK